MTKDSLIKGTIILAAAAFVARFLGLLQKVPLQYILGDDGLATFGIAYSIYGMLLIVATGGIPSALSKMISERYALGRYAEARRVYLAAVWFALIGGLLSSALLYALAPLHAVYVAKDPQAVLAIRAIAPALLIFPLIAIMRGYFQGRQMMAAGGISQIIEQILRVSTAVGVAFIFLSLGYTNEKIAAGASFGAVTGAIAAFAVMLYYHRRLQAQDIKEGRLLHRDKGLLLKLPPTRGRGTVARILYESELAEAKSSTMRFREIYKLLLRLSIPISIISLTVPMVYFIDTSTVIGFLHDLAGYTEQQAKEALGILTGKGQSLAGIPPILAIAMSTSVVPVISSAYAQQDMREVNDKASLALRLSLLSGMLLVILLSVQAQPVIGFLFSHDGGWEIAAIMTSSSIFQIMMMTSGAILMGLGQIRAPMVFVFIGIIAKLLGSYMLAPWLGIYGVVLATMLCFALIMQLNIYTLKKTIPFQVMGERWKGFLLSSLITILAGSGCMWLTSNMMIWNATVTAFLRLVLCSPVMMLIYAVGLVRLRVLTLQDLAAFPGAVRKLLKPFERYFSK